MPTPGTAATARARLPSQPDAPTPLEARAMEVEYCAECSCPYEYCEYASCARVAAAKLEKVALSDDAAGDAPATSAAAADAAGDAAGDAGAEETKKKSSSSKKSKSKAKEVVITRLSRNRKKQITNVQGLDAFDVDLKDASKMFGKKFACGCSVTKGATGKDELDLQGDYSEQLGELILAKYANIEESDLRYVDKSKF